MFGVSYVHSFWIAGLESDLSIHTAVSVTGYSGEEWVFLKRRDRLQVQVNIDFCQERAVIVVIFNKDLHETKYAHYMMNSFSGRATKELFRNIKIWSEQVAKLQFAMMFKSVNRQF